VAGVRDLLSAIYDSHFDDAEKRAAKLERAFRGAAGTHAALCDMEVRRHRYPIARAHCRDALRRYGDAAWAHYLTGLLDKHDSSPKSAVEHLERAIALDPDLENAYEVAAELYTQLGRADDKKRVGEKYKTKFGRALP